MRYLMLCLAFLTACATTPAASAAAAPLPSIQMDPKRTVEVLDVIDGSAFLLAEQVEKLTREGAPNADADLWLLINSPGGMTIPGFTLADALEHARSRGVRVRCVVGVLAASMAFDLLAYCDDRYALPHAKLLFHPLRVVAPQGLTAEEMRPLHEEMVRTEARMTRDLRRMMGVDGTDADRAWFYRHYRAETMWEAGVLVDATATGSRSGWLQLVERVEGTAHLYQFQRPRLSPFDAKRQAPPAAQRPAFIRSGDDQ